MLQSIALYLFTDITHESWVHEHEQNTQTQSNDNTQQKLSFTGNHNQKKTNIY